MRETRNRNADKELLIIESLHTPKTIAKTPRIQKQNSATNVVLDQNRQKEKTRQDITREEARRV